jgi:uncharacterized membrane protein
MAPERMVAVMAAATAGAFLIGSVATIQLWMLRAIRSTSQAAIAQAAVIVEEAVMAAATGVAIDAAALSEKQRFFGPPQGWFF